MPSTTPPTIPGPSTVSTVWADRVSAWVAELRPDWPRHGIRTALLRVADRPLAVVFLAALRAATTRPEPNPAIIAEPGPHWDWPTPDEAGAPTWCDHGRPGALHCPDCRPPAQRTGPTPEQRAQIRAGLRKGHAATAQRHNPEVVRGEVA